ncbi:MAG: S41 family peptidase [Bacteroidota bacterium]
MKQLLFLFFLLINLQIIAQKLVAVAVREDLNFLAEHIRKYNPALSHYHPKFDSLSTQVIERVPQDSVSLFTYFSAVSRICAFANEGHFKIGDRDDVFRKGISEDTYAYLPIQVKIVAGRVFLYGDFSDEQIMRRGDEIIAINGMNVKNVLDALLELTPSDGEIMTYAYRKIEDRFNSLYYLHIERPDTFKINFLDKNKEERTILLKALVRSDQIKNLKKYYPNNDSKDTSTPDSFYSLEITDDYALLKLASFDFRKVNKFKVKSTTLYKTIFKVLQDKKVQHLVIDLRDNTGGRNEFADDMLPFILSSPSTDKYVKKTISWEGKEKLYKMPSPSKLAFKGSIYALVNGKTFSAGSSLARFLKEYGNATVIGTETGTRYEGFAAGSNQDINLPNTGLTVGIPRYHILYPESVKQKTTNRGLLPDYEIAHTFETYSKRIDLHIKKVTALISEEQF